MRQREFIGLLGGAAAAWPLPVRAQPTQKVARIAVIGPSAESPVNAAQYELLKAELGKLGFGAGDLTIDIHPVDDPRGQPFVAAAECARPDLVFAYGPEVALQAVIGASGTTPIVIIAINYDPIERGYVKSLARPGGNITGVFYRSLELAAKQVELLKEAFPNAKRLGVLWDAFSADQFASTEKSAKERLLELHPLKLERPPYDFVATFGSLASSGAQMVLVLSSPHFINFRQQVADAAKQHRLPTMFIFKSYVQAGGLMSYGVDPTPILRRVAEMMAKILRGTKPADVPLDSLLSLNWRST
jgi:putative ABC transport system substrate-binding protein